MVESEWKVSKREVQYSNASTKTEGTPLALYGGYSLTIPYYRIQKRIFRRRSFKRIICVSSTFKMNTFSTTAKHHEGASVLETKRRDTGEGVGRKGSQLSARAPSSTPSKDGTKRWCAGRHHKGLPDDRVGGMDTYFGRRKFWIGGPPPDSTTLATDARFLRPPGCGSLPTTEHQPHNEEGFTGFRGTDSV